MDSCDVVVVGGGPAELSGAVAVARSRRSVLVVDAGEPRNAPADGVHDLLGQEGRSPAELLAGRDELWRYGGRTVRGTAVGARRDADGDLTVELGDGSAVGALATSPLAMHGALLWRQLTDDVTVFLPDPHLLSDDDHERLAARDVRVVVGEVTALETADGRLSGVRLADGRVVARQVLVVAPRSHARSAVLAGLGVEPEELRTGDTVVGTAVPAARPASRASLSPATWPTCAARS